MCSDDDDDYGDDDDDDDDDNDHGDDDDDVVVVDADFDDDGDEDDDDDHVADDDDVVVDVVVDDNDAHSLRFRRSSAYTRRAPELMSVVMCFISISLTLTVVNVSNSRGCEMWISCSTRKAETQGKSSGLDIAACVCDNKNIITNTPLL